MNILDEIKKIRDFNNAHPHETYDDMGPLAKRHVRTLMTAFQALHELSVELETKLSRGNKDLKKSAVTYVDTQLQKRVSNNEQN